MPVETHYCMICRDEGDDFRGNRDEVTDHVVDEHGKDPDRVDEYVGAIPDEGLEER